MSSTIKQALQQGISAHKAGKLQEAENIYQTILKNQPMQPHANYNLGLIAMSKNQIDSAIKFFKNAVNTDSKVEQFWVSYIDALLKDNQIENAKSSIKKAIDEGFNKGKMEAIIAHTKPSTKSNLPSSEKLKLLLQYYQVGDFSEAEKLARTLINEFPSHPFSWKVIGAILGQTGRLDESLMYLKQSVRLSDEDAEAHNNLGNVYIELGKINDAETSYRKAITLKPDYAEAHNNLGNSLKKLGMSEKAEECLRKAISLKPNFTEAHSNLGSILNNLGRLDEAEDRFRKAISLNPNYAEAHNNLGAILKEFGRLNEAEASCRQAVLLKPDYEDARYNLGLCLFYSKQYGLALKEFEKVNTGLSKSYAIRCSYLNDKEPIFLKKLDSLIKDGEKNAIIGSIINSSEIKYGIKKSNPFCNEPLRFVLNKDLNTDYNFREIFISNIRGVLDDESVSLKSQPFLTNGIQTAGNIFALDEISKTPIEDIIRKEIENYRLYFERNNEGFLKNWPTSYNLEGWLVSMRSGGKLDPHIHESGWISGSVYINVPNRLDEDSGSLVLCLDENMQSKKTKNNPQETVIKVETGSLCLFPSSLYHYTIPFKDDEDRIVLAFDVMPT
ncbi:MAG: hypothetical protein CMQ54_05520 [Gammaproteobacteria bacterium]|nr:hypothetical protein [Gammaproteobacteria bacterium]